MHKYTINSTFVMSDKGDMEGDSLSTGLNDVGEKKFQPRKRRIWKNFVAKKIALGIRENLRVTKEQMKYFSWYISHK